MRKHVWILLILATLQTGCSIEQGGAYELVSLTHESRQELERDKREALSIEDIKIGNGPLAAWGRKIRADIEVRYVDGTLVYRGPMLYYSGFVGSPFIHNALKEAGVLGDQAGIWIGLNGMAVGGKQRITIDPKLVISGLLVTGRRTHEDIGVLKQKLIVDATLTASCIPVLLRALHVNIGYVLEREIWCHDTDMSKRDSSDPIWRFY